MPRGSSRPPSHSEDVVLQGPEAIVNSSVDNVLWLALAQPRSLPFWLFPFFGACQDLELGVDLSLGSTLLYPKVNRRFMASGCQDLPAFNGVCFLRAERLLFQRRYRSKGAG